MPLFRYRKSKIEEDKMKKITLAAGIMLVFLFAAVTSFAADEEIALSGAKSGDFYTSDIAVTFSFSDEKGIKSAEYLLEDKSLGEVKNEASEGMWPDRISGSFEMKKDLLAKEEPQDFSYTLKIAVTDAEDKKSMFEKKFSANVNAPAVLVSGAEEGGIYNASKKIKITVSDENASKDTLTVKITRNGESIIDKTAPAEEEFSFLAEDEGVYLVRAQAEDNLKRKDVKELSFTVDKTAPVISDADISGHKKAGFDWFDDSFSVSADAEDVTSGIKEAKILVNGSEIYSEEKSVKELHIDAAVDKAFLAAHEAGGGKYIVEIRVKDAAGNEAVKRTETYADVTAPAVKLYGIREGEFTNENPEITAESEDNTAATNEVRLEVKKDGTPYRSIKEKEKASFSAFSKDGYYTVSAVSVDRAGNVSEEKTLHFTKDTVAPVISLSGAKEGSFTRGPKKITARVRELNYKGASAAADVSRVLDGKKYAMSFGTIDISSQDFSKASSFNATGTYTIVLTARDEAGNVSKPVRLTFTIDNEKPVIKITGVPKVGGYDAKIAPKVTVEDSYFSEKKISLLRASGKSIRGLGYKEQKSEKGESRNYRDFAREKGYDDTYTISCTAKDKAGNTSTVSMTFAVDRFGSVFKVTKGAGMSGEYMKKAAEKIVITERNVTELKTYKAILKLDGERQDTRIGTDKTYSNGWNSYRYTFPVAALEKEGVYELDTVSEDAAGNSSSFSEGGEPFRFYVDRTAPVITAAGIENGQSMSIDEAKLKLSVSDAIGMGSFNVTSGGKVIYSSINDGGAPSSKEIQIPAGIRQDIHIAATDRAGNATSMDIQNVTVSSSLFIRIIGNTPLLIGIIAGIIVIAGLAFLLIRRRKSGDDIYE